MCCGLLGLIPETLDLILVWYAIICHEEQYSWNRPMQHEKVAATCKKMLEAKKHADLHWRFCIGPLDRLLRRMRISMEHTLDTVPLDLGPVTQVIGLFDVDSLLHVRCPREVIDTSSRVYDGLRDLVCQILRDEGFQAVSHGVNPRINVRVVARSGVPVELSFRVRLRYSTGANIYYPTRLVLHIRRG